MSEPTQAQAVAWSLAKLGGSAKTDEIRAQIARKWGASHPLAKGVNALHVLLFRENGRLWIRTEPETYKLTEEGTAEAEGAIRALSPTLDKW